MQYDSFTHFLYSLVSRVGETFRLTKTNWLRLKVARTSGLLSREEKQIIDRIFYAVERKRIIIVEHSLSMENPLSYQEYKMLCHNQPAEYFCQLFNRIIETETLSETELTMLQKVRGSRDLNPEEKQIVKRILYSIKRQRIKLARTSSIASSML